MDPASTSTAARGRLAAAAWVVSELLAFAILAVANGMRFSTETVLCMLAGPLAMVTAIPRFKYHGFFGNAGFVLGFALLAALPFLHVGHPRRWTLALSLLAWLLWPWLGVAFTIRHV